MTTKRKIIAITPFVSVIAFVLMLTYLPEDYKKFSWLAFLLIPIVLFLAGEIKIKVTYPIVVTALFLLLGFTLDWWHPGWILFITIPVYYILTTPNKKRFGVHSDDVEEGDIR